MSNVGISGGGYRRLREEVPEFVEAPAGRSRYQDVPEALQRNAPTRPNESTSRRRISLFSLGVKLPGIRIPPLVSVVKTTTITKTDPDPDNAAAPNGTKTKNSRWTVEAMAQTLYESSERTRVEPRKGKPGQLRSLLDRALGKNDSASDGGEGSGT